jgi:hypothetical protein
MNKRITLTRDLAYASSRDAGNRSMRKACRKVWNVDDWNASVDEFNRLWPIERELESRRIEAGYCPACEKPHDSAVEKFRCLKVQQLAETINA